MKAERALIVKADYSKSTENEDEDKENTREKLHHGKITPKLM